MSSCANHSGSISSLRPCLTKSVNASYSAMKVGYIGM